ncbi:MAG: GNAT family N-acetyltransferase [Gammaproteobacteria bacterium]|jgi:predicted N-acyltransferase|nr:GNAT family N-acetyltransferase [Gammaproteobacteria bacterium]
MRIECHADIDALDPAQWDALAGPQPFLSHAFFSALARHGAIGGDSGWQPRFLVLVGEDGRWRGALPAFLKHHSFGEFVFDWDWAEAYRRHGLRYYPKLVVGVPYTPVTGPRLLLAPGAGDAGRAALVDAALELAQDCEASSLHWLFTDETDTALLRQRGMMVRDGCQFHWRNRGYRDFDDFLDTLSSRYRKQVRAERRSVREQGLAVELMSGASAAPALWDEFHRFYLSTFERKGNFAPLPAAFFRDVGEALGERIVLILARRGGRCIGGAFFWLAAGTLYGRHWGAIEECPNLHFELCYYRAIEYCIAHGVQCFEGGAQGEYKLRRGFEPVVTRSAHWIAHDEFARAISRYVDEERDAVGRYVAQAREHLPFRRAHAGG